MAVMVVITETQELESSCVKQLMHLGEMKEQIVSVYLRLVLTFSL